MKRPQRPVLAQRIIEVLSDGQHRTTTEIAALVYATRDSVVCRVREMREGYAPELPRVRIGSWRAPEGMGNYAAAYTLGDEPDARKVLFGRKIKRKRPLSTEAKILLFVAAEGPKSAAELAEHLGLAYYTASATARRMRKDGPTIPMRRLNVAKYALTEATHKPYPVYGIGNAWDAKYKAQTRTELNRAYRERHATKLALKRRLKEAEENGIAPGVFNWMMCSEPA